MKGDFASIDDLIDDSRARVLADRENISYENALARVQTSKQQAQMQAQMQQQLSPEAINEAARKASLQAFLKEYPTVNAKDIPKEVWDDMRNTNSLVASYARWEAKKLAAENEALRQNAKNRARSVGSMKSSGKSSQEKSEFDRVMEDDEYY